MVAYNLISDRLQVIASVRCICTAEAITLIERRYPLSGHQPKLVEHFRSRHGLLRIHDPDAIVAGVEIVLSAEKITFDDRDERRRIVIRPATADDAALPLRETGAAFVRALRFMGGCVGEQREVAAALEPVL